MTSCLVFNHHSLPFDCNSDVDQAMPEFIKICLSAKNTGFPTILVDETLDSSWFRVELSSGYFWCDWYKRYKDEDYRDSIRAFRSIVTQTPFFDANSINEGSDLYEVELDGRNKYTAVSAASWHKAPLVGFATRNPWKFSPLQVSVTQIDTETGQLKTSNETIYNFCKHSVFESSLPDLIAARDSLLSNGREISRHFAELYPLVVLCGKAKQQLENWSANRTILDQAIKCFSVLNLFVLKWQNGDFDSYSSEGLHQSGLSFKVHGESESVKTNPNLKREREFWLPSGEKKFFEQHICLSNGYRLHFYPENESKLIYVGYIGPHLSL